jgi:hypothetical protein
MQLAPFPIACDLNPVILSAWKQCQPLIITSVWLFHRSKADRAAVQAAGLRVHKLLLRATPSTENIVQRHRI